MGKKGDGISGPSRSQLNDMAEDIEVMGIVLLIDTGFYAFRVGGLGSVDPSKYNYFLQSKLLGCRTRPIKLGLRSYIFITGWAWDFSLQI